MTTIVKAAKVFGIVNHLELLHPDELLALGVDPTVPPSPRHVLEWEVESSRLSAWERTANGIQYQVAKLRHRFLLEGRFARGKCYELRHLPTAERRQMEERLNRHPAVCERIGKHPNIAKNLTAAFVEDGGLWWEPPRQPPSFLRLPAVPGLDDRFRLLPGWKLPTPARSNQPNGSNPLNRILHLL